jgi:hypothetical protein
VRQDGDVHELADDLVEQDGDGGLVLVFDEVGLVLGVQLFFSLEWAVVERVIERRVVDDIVRSQQQVVVELVVSTFQ